MTFDEIEETKDAETLDFSDLPNGFCERTAKAVLKICYGYSVGWKKFYEKDGMREAAIKAMEENTLQPLWENEGAIHGAQIVGSAMMDDWKIIMGDKQT